VSGIMSNGVSLAPEDIGNLLSQTCISTAHPWCTNDEVQIDAFYRNICSEIAQSTGTSTRIEWNHYGSGYASFVDAWFYKPLPEFYVPELAGDGKAYAGVAVLLSRLSPYFVLMQGEKQWHDRGGSSYMPCIELVDNFSRAVVEALAEEIQALLQEHGLRRLRRDDVSLPLPDGTAVPTILSDEPFTVFDAVFHWED
jgi:hypothetical protein